MREQPERSRNPLDMSPLRDRDDLVAAARAVCEPAAALMSASGARLASAHDRGRDGAPLPPSAHLEAFARPLWAMAPLALVGAADDLLPAVRAGLIAGTDPAHPDHWGVPSDLDQRLVERGTIGAALLIAPEQLWTPLDEASRRAVLAWLAAGDDCRAHANNWQWFGLLADLGRMRAGKDVDLVAHGAALAAIERRALGDGWYDDRPGDDGRPPQCDWYSAFADHVYGLLYAWSGLGDPAAAQRYRERAAAFALQLRAWFAPDGAAIAYGRSLTYRWAQAAFWAILAAADVDVLPWGEVKGLYLRNLRHWSTFDVADTDGALTIGYRGTQPTLGERYISPASPLWACKGFLGLLVPADHPFWTAAEAPAANPAGPVAQPAPGFVLSHDAAQALAVGGRQWAPGFVSDGTAKYERLAYSSLLPPIADRADADGSGRGQVSDSTLSLTDRLGARVVRSRPERFEIDDECAVSTWRPWADVVVHTAVWGAAPWHVRAHVVRTDRELTADDWGFALDAEHDEYDTRSARAWGPSRCSGILDVSGGRDARTAAVPDTAAILGLATRVPVLSSRLGPGRHVLVTAVYCGADWSDWSVPPDAAGRLLQLVERREREERGRASRRWWRRGGKDGGR